MDYLSSGIATRLIEYTSSQEIDRTKNATQIFNVLKSSMAVIDSAIKTVGFPLAPEIFESDESLVKYAM